MIAQAEQQKQPEGHLDHLVSVFRGVTATTVVETVPLRAVLRRIQDGTYHDAIAQVRGQRERGEAAYKRAKEALPSFTPCCALRTRARNVPWSAKLLSTTGSVHFDFDNVPDPAQLKAGLAANPSTVFAFISPGADGVKANMAVEGITDEGSYKYAWRVVLSRLKKAYPDLDIRQDEHVKFLNALCFVSDDPAIYVNPDAVPLLLPVQAPEEEAPFPEPITPAAAAHAPDYATVTGALPHIPCEDYATWWRVGLSLKRGGQPWARALWDGWSQQSTKYTSASQQYKWDDFPDEGTIHPYTVLTIAAEHGWHPAGRGQEQAEGIGLDGGDEGLSSLSSLSSQNEENAPSPVFASEEELNSLFSLNSQLFPTLREEAFHGIAGELVRRIEPQTEADPAALLLQFLVYFGAMVGRHPYYLVGATRHYPNLFAVLVGSTSKGRKGSAYDYIDAVMRGLDVSWSLDNTIRGCGSGEGLIHAVRDPVVKTEPVKVKGKVVDYQEVVTDGGVTDKRLLVHEPEFASVLKIAQREGNILSMTLRQAWDGGPLHNIVKTSPQRATNAHIALVGHITTDEVTKLLSTTEAANGFGNRFLWVTVTRSKSLPEGGDFSRLPMQDIHATLRKALQQAQAVTQMHRDDGARRAWATVYDTLSTPAGGLAGNLLARGEASVLRLSMLYALLDCSATIRVEHLRAALAVWEYIEASVAQVFGSTTGNPEADALRDALKWAEKGMMDKTAMIKEVFHGHIKAHALNTAIRLLLKEGSVTRQFAPSQGGRRREYICYGGETTQNSLARNPKTYIDLIQPIERNGAVKMEKSCEFSEESEESPFGGVVAHDGETKNRCEESEESEESPLALLAVPDMTGGPSDGIPFTIPENGSKNGGEVPMREPGEEEPDDEEGVIA